MKNFVQPGDVLTLVAPADCKSGDVITVGAFTGVATYDAKAGQEIETAIVGVFELAKAAGALEPGALVYWDAGAKKATGSAGEGDALLIGAAVSAAGADAATCRVRLNGITTG